MLIKILNLKGAQKMSKKEQLSINGGGHNCVGWPNGRTCNGLGHICCNQKCLPPGDPACFTVGG